MAEKSDTNQEILSFIDNYFNGLRFNKNFHMGMGDIRLTIGMQDDILDGITEIIESAEKGKNHD